MVLFGLLCFVAFHYPLGDDFTNSQPLITVKNDSADVGMSFATLVELSGKTRRRPASVQSGTSAISYMSKIDTKLDDCVVVQSLYALSFNTVCRWRGTLE